VRAFRCQLPRRNPHYSHDPAPDSQEAPPKLSVSRPLPPWPASRGPRRLKRAQPPPQQQVLLPLLLLTGGLLAALQEADALVASSRDPWGAAEAEQQAAAGRRQPRPPPGLHLWPEQELVNEPEPEDELEEGGEGGAGVSEVQR
jgi:hypothetical protein